MIDTESDKQYNEKIIQQKKLNSLELEYKIFTSQYDEITKAENLYGNYLGKDCYKLGSVYYILGDIHF